MHHISSRLLGEPSRLQLLQTLLKKSTAKTPGMEYATLREIDTAELYTAIYHFKLYFVDFVINPTMSIYVFEMSLLVVRCTVKESVSDVAYLKELPWYNRVTSTTNLHTLAAADKWYMDGNFAMVPPTFLQLYVIHVSLRKVTIPLVYAVLENKTEATCHKLFTAVLNCCATIDMRPDPDIATVDFEQALPRALTAVFR